MTATTKQKRSRKPAAKSATRSTVKAGEPKRRIRLPYTLNTEASDRFRALPPAERRRRLEAFREVGARLFKSSAEYIAEKRREDARDRDT